MPMKNAIQTTSSATALRTSSKPTTAVSHNIFKSQTINFVSATNCSHLYGIAQTRRTHNDTDHWQFGNVITTEQVWDCFVILALLDGHQLRGEHLVVLHDGNQKNCLMEAMYGHNACIVLQGQEELPHACLRYVEEWYEHNKACGAVHFHQAPTTTSTGVLAIDGCSAKDILSKIKPTFRRQHTNNEQLIVHPCGIISGCGTMYHHEAVSNVLIMVEKMFSLPCTCKPQHLIYDSNCNTLWEVESRKIAFFEGMGMCVDAFHHKTKHKASDVFCCERCDMKAYPELLNDDGKYYFNSSIAEQTNVWFGSFHNICREMTPVKYDFFLMK
ncbi:hypothetical protein BDR03DRAFT_980326 [Suillus americanus]|nr:hypothetical protein BDR03DRAFT_980326 [Suillus americanus]